MRHSFVGLLLCALAGGLEGSAVTTGANPEAEAAPAPRPSSLRPLAQARFVVTQGALEPLPPGRFGISAPQVRAVATGSDGKAADLHFTYLGPTAELRRLGSGAVRRQIGLKLRARDSCNVIYVMWRLEPRADLVVSVKQNPGMFRHAECRNEGYRTIQPEHFRPAPPVRAGESHALRAELEGERLTVFVDGTQMWVGTLGPEALQFDGPVGLRTDNGRFELELFARY